MEAALEHRRLRLGSLPDCRTVVCVAGGSSFTAAQARLLGMAAHRGIIIIAINDAIYPCWFANMLYACDPQWWDLHWESLQPWRYGGGHRVSLGVAREGHPFAPNHSDVWWVECSGTDGWDDDPDKIRSGGNSGYQAIQIAVKGFRPEKVILVGYDMQGKHFFGDHPAQIRMHPNMNTWVQGYNELGNILDRRGVRVVNASPGSALKRFPAVDLAAALAEA